MRDYKKDPLKHGELPNKEEFYDLYINQNYSRLMLQEYYNVGRTKIFSIVKKFGFVKTEEQKKLTAIQTSLFKHGTSHPRKNKENNKQITDKCINTCLEKYGVENISQSPIIKEKVKNTFIKHYGTTSIAGLPEIREKIKQTSLERYGVEHASQCEENKQKHRHTNQQRYGKNSYFQTDEFKEKSKQTCLEKYGNINPTATENIQEKIKQTNLKKYGHEWNFCNEEIKQKSKQTCLEKYGVENYSQTKEYKQKTIKTCQQKYGYDYASQSPKFREQVEKTNLEKYGHKCSLWGKEQQEKSKQTLLQKYGVEHISKNPEFVEKQWQGRKRNKTTSSSKAEEYIYSRLKERFINVKRNYSDDIRYPFHVDFYIPEIDLFIEYQGFEGHGGAPFDNTNTQHMKKLTLWVNRFQQDPTKTKYYEYIKVWTVNDILKRNTAKQNKLNYLEFFTVKEFDNWFSS